MSNAILFVSLPRILLSPLAGALVDRWDRRLAMLLSDLGSGLCTLAVALLLFANRLQTVLLIDFATFLLAVFTLMVIRFPRPPQSAEGAAAHGSLLQEAISGWSYIARRPGLLGLLVLYAATWFLGVPAVVLLQPYVLSFASPDMRGLIVSITGAGFLAGGLVTSAWGGPKRRIYEWSWPSRAPAVPLSHCANGRSRGALMPERIDIVLDR